MVRTTVRFSAATARITSQRLRRACGSRPGRRLVEEHDLGVVHEREGDREALLLAARELARLRLGLLLEPDQSPAAVIARPSGATP